MERQGKHRFEGEGIRRLLFASPQDFTKKRKEEPGIVFYESSIEIQFEGGEVARTCHEMGSGIDTWREGCSGGR